MVTVLITSFLLLAAILYAVSRRQTPESRERSHEYVLPHAEGFSGLFAEEAAREQRELKQAAEQAARETERAELLSRAAAGERSALLDARRSDDARLYDEVLTTLVEQIASDKALLALVSYMLREEPAFKVNRRLAERFIEAWRRAPDRSFTAKMLHVTALANDAALYRKALEAVLDVWRAGLIEGLSAGEFRSLAESEYWLLSQNERSSGQGFLLKLKLAALRRELTRDRSATRLTEER